MSEIERAIQRFGMDRVILGKPVFKAVDLENYIRSLIPTIAPGPPCRIMRKMRTEGRINYRVQNRNKSLYEMRWL